MTAPIRLGYHGSPLVAQRIADAAGARPGEVTLVLYDIADPFHAIRSGLVDLMIVKFGIDEPDLVCGEVVDYDARAVVMSARHPLASRESVSIEEVAAYDAFDRPGNFPESVWDDVVPRQTPAGRPIRRVHRVTTIPQMMRIVAASHAVHISLISLADVAPEGIRVVPINDLPPAPVSLAWLRDALVPAHVASFLAAV